MDMKKILTDANAIAFLLFVAVLHGLYNSGMQLHEDEAFYWFWSTHLQLGYFDHPPMVAYIIRFFTLFGDSEFFVRLGAIVCMSISSWYVYLLSKEIFDTEVAWLTLVTSAILPATFMGYTIITPDAPLILFWTTATYYSYRALFSDRWSDYILAGIHIGLLMLSKYTSVLFLGFLLIYILIKMPRKLFKLKPWAAIAIAFTMFTPVIFWNYQHDWMSFLFQYQHGSAPGFQIHICKFFEFFGGLFLLFTPVFFGILLFGTFKFRNWFFDKRRFYIVLSYLLPLLFFLYKALFKKMELNWAAIVFIPGMILFVYTVKKYSLWKLYRWGAALSILLTLVLLFPALFFLPPSLNIHNRIFGYREVITHIQPYLREGDTISSDRHYRAALFSYYTKGHPMAYIPTPTTFRPCLQPEDGFDLQASSGIYYSKVDMINSLRAVFPKVELLEKFTASKEGFTDKVFYIYRYN
jgi:4-amino-4-deoxy-L-arabinose transferase-like glycosyltransferase